MKRWNANARDTHRRTLLKAFVWRITGVLWAVAVIWFLTGDLLLGAEAGVIYNVIRFFTYYIYERVWERIPWGRVKNA